LISLRFHPLALLVSLFFISVLWVPFSMGQISGTAALSGIVTNGSGEPIEGVRVTLVNRESGQSREALTSAGGDYGFMLLSPGSYQMSFSAAGFKTTEVVSIAINAGETPNASPKLEPGMQSDKIMFFTESQASQAQTSASGTVVEAGAVSNLPLTSRNFTQALGITAGVSGEVTNASNIGKGSQDVQSGGGKSNNYSMDGASVGTSTGNLFEPGIGVPNPDAIQVLSVQTSLYDAGARNAGASVNVITKSGTSAFHGTVFEFVRNDIFNANDFFLKRLQFRMGEANRRPVLKQNQFGFTFGGPIIKKLLFFTSYQGTRQRNGIAAAGFSSSVVLPSLPEMRTAESVGAAFCPENHPGAVGYQTLFGGVQVACNGSNINPVALNFLNLKLPDGSYYIPSSEGGGFQNTPITRPAKFQEDQILGNIDYLVSAKHTLTEKFFYSRAPQISSFSGGATSLPGASTEILGKNVNNVLQLRSVLSSSLTNEARMSAQHSMLNNMPLIKFTNEEVGITSLMPEINLIDPITIAGLFGAGRGDWSYSSVNQFQWSDQISWTHGKHTVRAGFELDRRQWNTRFLSFSRGALTFMSFPDFLLGLPGCPPGASAGECSADNPVVDGVLTNGSPFSNLFSTTGYLTDPDGVYHANRIREYSGYVQDDFLFSSQLTVNLGLRWEYFGFPRDLRGDITNIWISQILTAPVPPAGGTYAGFVVPSNFQREMAPGVSSADREIPISGGPPLKNFAPRIGFSWRPSTGLPISLRGGYGFFYDQPGYSQLIAGGLRNRPYTTAVEAVGSANYFSSFAIPFASASLGWGSPRWIDSETGQSSNLSGRLIQEDFGTPLLQKWNLNIEYEFIPQWAVEIGYAGSHGIHLQEAGRQINTAPLASESNPINGITVSTVSNASLRVPYLGFAPASFDWQGTDGDSKYNSFQASLRKRLSRGMQFQAAYSFNKTLTTMSTGLMNSNNPSDARQQYGVSNMIRPHRFVINYSWDLPFKGTGLVRHVVADWSLSGVTTIQSGMPLTITDNRGGTIYGGGASSRAQFCDGKGNSDVASSGSPADRVDSYFNLNGVFCPPPAIGDGTGYGNSGIGIVRGPDQANWDLGLNKNISIKETRLSFRVEFFNIFNHGQFSNPNTNAGNPVTFGKINSASVNPRLIQFGAKYTF
jgi:hypothetical protein